MNYKDKVINYLQTEWLRKPLEETIFGKIDWENPLEGEVTSKQAKGCEVTNQIYKLISNHYKKGYTIPYSAGLIYEFLVKNKLHK